MYKLLIENHVLCNVVVFTFLGRQLGSCSIIFAMKHMSRYIELENVEKFKILTCINDIRRNIMK